MQCLADVVKAFYIQGDLSRFVFTHGGPAFVDQISQLLERQSLDFPVHTNLFANENIDIVHKGFLFLFHEE